MTYHNTTHTAGAQLDEYEGKADSQDEIILLWFKFSGGSHTPSEIHSVLFPDVPITSVRRSISNLTAGGYLQKTDHQKLGPYKRPEYQWELAA
jgi:hypothetical protein